MNFLLSPPDSNLHFLPSLSIKPRKPPRPLPHTSKHLLLATSLNHHHFQHALKIAKKRGDLFNKNLHILFSRVDPQNLPKDSFKALTRLFSKNHNISRFHFQLLTPASSAHSPNAFIFQHLQTVFRNNSKIKRLSFNLYPLDFPLNEAAELFKNVSKLPALENLFVSVKQFSHFEPLVLLFCQAIRRALNLKRLHLSIGKKEEELKSKLLVYTALTFGSSLLEKLSSYLPALPKLEEFHFYASQELEDKAVENLLAVLPEMKKLQSFYYEPYATKFIMLQLLEPISDIEGLKSFGFNFSTVEDETTFEEMMYFSTLTGLKELKITFKSVPLRKCMSLLTVLKSIANFENLETLVLEFELNSNMLACLTQEGEEDVLENLFAALSDSLIRLKLNISNTNNRGLRLCSQALKNLKRLRYFSLILKNCPNLNDKPFGELAGALGVFTELSHLQISFNNCPLISDKVMYPLSKSLEKLTKMHSFGVSFLSCEKISDKSFGYLQGALTQLKHLETLTVEYQGCEMVTDLLIKYLRGLGEIKSLKALHLTLSKCAGVTEQGINDLGEVVQRLKGLREFYFVPDHHQISNQLFRTFLNKVDLMVTSLCSEDDLVSLGED